MKVLLKTITKEQAVQEIVEAIEQSFTFDDTDVAFNWRRVMVDGFIVPPKTVEWWDNPTMIVPIGEKKENPQPSRVALLEALTIPDGGDLMEEKRLDYAAVVYRLGKRYQKQEWGGRLYFVTYNWKKEVQEVVCLDCQENVTQEGEHLPTGWPDLGLAVRTESGYSLAGLCATAVKRVTFEGPEVSSQLGFGALLSHKISVQFRNFLSGLAEIDTVARKAHGLRPDDDFLGSYNMRKRRLLRFAWAWESMPSAHPVIYTKDAGKRLEELFAEAKAEAEKAKATAASAR